MARRVRPGGGRVLLIGLIALGLSGCLFEAAPPTPPTPTPTPSPVPTPTPEVQRRITLPTPAPSPTPAPTPIPNCAGPGKSSTSTASRSATASSWRTPTAATGGCWWRDRTAPWSGCTPSEDGSRIWAHPAVEYVFVCDGRRDSSASAPNANRRRPSPRQGRARRREERAGSAMGTRKRVVHERTEDWAQLRLLLKWPEQVVYELGQWSSSGRPPANGRTRPARPSGPSTARPTGSTSAGCSGSASKRDPAADPRGLPPPIRQRVDLRAEVPGLSLREIADICAVQLGRRPPTTPSGRCSPPGRPRP